jgi:hypothetical protein
MLKAMTPRTYNKLKNGGFQNKNCKKFNKKYMRFLKCASRFVSDSRPTKVKASIGDWKMILIAAFHKRRIIAWQFLPRNVMVNYANYLEFLENRLHPEVRKARIHRPLILHDNATPHK